MEEKIQKRSFKDSSLYSKDDISVATEFTKKALKEFGSLVKAAVLFGSVAREDKVHGDIDVLFIVDDVTIVITPSVAEAYRVIVANLIKETSERLHVTTIKLSSFWEYVRAGDPIGINMLREGIPLLDSGFFEPLKMLLAQGRIRPSPESVWSYFSRAPRSMGSSKWHVNQGVIDLYWAVIDSAHAALMKLGQTPPSPEHVADLLNECMVKEGHLDAKYVETMRKFYTLSRNILHGELKEVSGVQYDE
ncbi:hypothetical protein COY95_01010, partial [Candidatus Woesearchaeota archaeon CG_4_10_14_0_8_um_filter_47_5]